MRFVWFEGDWVAAPWRPPAEPVAPYVVSDSMQPARHMVTGEVMDSKSTFRRATREAGCVEVGNDLPEVGPRPIVVDAGGVRETIAQSIRELEAGRPAPRVESADRTTRLYERHDKSESGA